MKQTHDERTLTRSEMEIMNILWTHSENLDANQEKGMTTHEIIHQYPEPQPAYSTIATFLKILTTKGFIRSYKQENSGKTFYFFPLITREAYTNRVMKEVKTTFFKGSLKSMLSFFMEQEEVSENELKEILSLINNK